MTNQDPAAATESLHCAVSAQPDTGLQSVSPSLCCSTDAGCCSTDPSDSYFRNHPEALLEGLLAATAGVFGKPDIR